MQFIQFMNFAECNYSSVYMHVYFKNHSQGNNSDTRPATVAPRKLKTSRYSLNGISQTIRHKNILSSDNRSPLNSEHFILRMYISILPLYVCI